MDVISHILFINIIDIYPLYNMLSIIQNINNTEYICRIYAIY